MASVLAGAARTRCTFGRVGSSRNQSIHGRAFESPLPRTRRRNVDAAAPNAADADAAANAAPWHIGAQTNERLLAWDEGAQAQLLKIHLCGQLGVTQDELRAQLEALMSLLPDLANRLHTLRAPLALSLLRDLPGVASRLLQLRELLPGADVSAAAAKCPELLLLTPVRVCVWGGGGGSTHLFRPPTCSQAHTRKHTTHNTRTRARPQIERLEAAVARLGEAMPGVAVGPLVEREPAVLRADMAKVLAEARRLMPVRAERPKHPPPRRCVPQLRPSHASHHTRPPPTIYALSLSLSLHTNKQTKLLIKTKQQKGRDPVALVAADPTAFLDMDDLAMPSTLEHN